MICHWNIANDVPIHAVRNRDKQMPQISINDDIINVVASTLEEKTEFVQTHFTNNDF